jgi:hypothetical protein
MSKSILRLHAVSFGICFYHFQPIVNLRNLSIDIAVWAWKIQIKSVFINTCTEKAGSQNRNTLKTLSLSRSLALFVEPFSSFAVGRLHLAQDIDGLASSLTLFRGQEPIPSITGCIYQLGFVFLQFLR